MTIKYRRPTPVSPVRPKTQFVCRCGWQGAIARHCIECDEHIILPASRCRCGWPRSQECNPMAITEHAVLDYLKRNGPTYRPVLADAFQTDTMRIGTKLLRLEGKGLVHHIQGEGQGAPLIAVYGPRRGEADA